MNISAIILLTIVGIVFGDCPTKKTSSKLICYYSKLSNIDSCKCTHVVLPADADVKSIDTIRERLKGVKILISVNEFNQGLVNTLKTAKIDGLDLNLKKLSSKSDISDFISTISNKFGTDLQIALSVPAKVETLAKFYDFKALSKNVDLFILQTAFLGASQNVTFHPSRLSGLWDMQNTDSVVDLVSGLGAPLSKLIITSSVQAYKFKLQNEKHTAPGSPALEVQSITRDELCSLMKNGNNWTLERDQDQTGPYIFSKDQWIAFDDPTSIDVKAKYARVRGLAGMALKDLSQDGGNKCKSSILEAAFNGLSRQARAPRGAVLHSLEREILETPVRPLDNIQVSPYRISRVIDVEGNIHVIRKDTRTEFECSRQGYFVHPRSCGRFYRCVKFDQLSDEFSVFEFDCPAGLAFDSRVEVCVWPGSLPHASPCAGSSEIAPVPRERFICPNEPGYYADPENCRWFFACLDHGKSPLSAYEFRCPFGLVYDESKYLCEWPWLVPKCASGYAVASEVAYGGAVTLDQYDGLGTLGVTALGGLHGPLQQPEAKIYSSVQTQGLYTQGLQSQGISSGSLQSLHTAGLLRNGVEGTFEGTQSKLGTANAHLVNGLAENYYQQNIGGVLSGSANAQLVDGLGENYYQQTSGGKLSGSTLGVGIKGSTNIVGGGYSAVGIPRDGLDINYEQGSSITHVTQTPLVVPAVTSVPVPSVSFSTDFQTYKGGVVANVPELQLKVQNNGFVNASNSFVNVVSSTPSTIIQKDGYHYDKPSVSFIEEPIKTNFVQKNLVNVVSTTQKPLVEVQPAITTYQKIQPVVTTYQKPIISTQVPVVEKFSIQQVQPEVTTYQKPIQPVITTYQKPIVTQVPYVEKVNLLQPAVEAHQKHVVVSTTQLPLVEKVSFLQPAVTYHQPIKPAVVTYQKPVVVSTTQTPIAVEKVNIQPAVAIQEVSAGYDYPKPAIKFDEKAQSVSYQNVDIVPKNKGYSYPKPAVAFEEVRPQVKVTSYNVPSSTITPIQQVTSYNTQSTVKPQFYVSSTQVPILKQEAVSVTSFQKQETLQPQVVPIVQQAPQVYVSSTPASVKQAVSYSTVQKEVQPQYVAYNVPSSTVKPIIQESVQPAVVSSFSISSNNLGYKYGVPAVAYEQKPLQPVRYNYPVPVSTYTYKNVLQSAIQDYAYPKPAVAFEEAPRQSVVVSSTPKTAIFLQNQPSIVNTYSYSQNVKPVTYVTKTKPQPAVVSSYSFTHPGYGYPKPEQPKPLITYENAEPVKEVPFIAKKAYVTGGQSYQYKQQFVSSTPKYDAAQEYVYEKPTVTVEQKPIVPVNNYQNVVSSTPKYEVKQQYSIDSGYVYQKPSVAFKETPQIVETYQKTLPVVNYQTVVSSTPKYEVKQQYSVDSGYVYQKPSVAFEEKPQIVEIYQKTVPVVNYQKSVSSTPRYELKQQYSVDSGYVYEKPSVVLQQKPQVIESYQNAVPVVNYQKVVSTTPRYESRQQYSVDSGYVYEKPSVAFEKKAKVVENYQINTAPIINTYVQSTPKPTLTSTIQAIVAAKQPFRYYDSRLTSTVRPVTYTTSLPIVQKVTPAVVPVTVSTSKPIVQYSFSSVDSKLSEIQPSVSTVASVVPIEVSTSKPFAKYSFSSLGSEVRPSPLPVSTVKPAIRYTSSPVVTEKSNLGRVVENYVAPNEVTQPTPVAVPSREYLPVKVTTPVSTYLPVTKVASRRPIKIVKVSRPKTIIKTNDFHPLLPAKLGAQCTCVSNTVRLRKKPIRIIVEDDENDNDDDGYVVENEGRLVENYDYEPQKIVEVTPTPEVYIKSTTLAPSPIPVVQKRIRVQPTESLEKTNQPSRNFDRYGPGGWRSRDETLQGTIDCQRAGLFRHPTQCNKFYSCRWDCTKNRFTLHVFNCPVHLTFDNNLGACNWPSQGPTCLENTLLPSD